VTVGSGVETQTSPMTQSAVRDSACGLSARLAAAPAAKKTAARTPPRKNE
jgi:hypothetical protein